MGTFVTFGQCLLDVSVEDKGTYQSISGIGQKPITVESVRTVTPIKHYVQLYNRNYGIREYVSFLSCKLGPTLFGSFIGYLVDSSLDSVIFVIGITPAYHVHAT